MRSPPARVNSNAKSPSAARPDFAKKLRRVIPFILSSVSRWIISFLSYIGKFGMGIHGVELRYMFNYKQNIPHFSEFFTLKLVLLYKKFSV